MAVGTDAVSDSPGRGYVAVWNGLRWASVALDSTASTRVFLTPKFLRCWSSTSCVLGGIAGSQDSGRLMIGWWNGSKWRIDALTSLPVALFGETFACGSPNLCLVGVNYQMGEGASNAELAAISSDGILSRDHVMPFRGASLIEVRSSSCPSESECVSAGLALGPHGAASFLTVWNGARWSTVHTEETVGSQVPWFMDVTCPTVNNCLVAGRLGGAIEGNHPQLWEWNGRTLSTFDPIATDKDGAEPLTASCASMDYCVVTGISWDRPNYYLAVAMVGTPPSDSPTAP